MTDAPSETRPLTADEYRLAKWMLDHGNQDAAPFREQLGLAEVTCWRCPCGCPSFNLTVNGKEPSQAAGLHILGDFLCGLEDQPSGIFIFEKEGLLAGVEVYGLAGDVPRSLPDPAELRPI